MWVVIIGVSMTNFAGHSRADALRAEMHGYVLIAEKSGDPFHMAIFISTMHIYLLQTLLIIDTILMT